jgi:serine kinase of HPr protein (carbohydrate metabolism regulator)
MDRAPRETVHATCIAIGGRGVLIAGPSGAGKSDLALRLIDRGARLVSDDYTDVIRWSDHLIGRPPATIAGTMEVRGIGIVRLPHLAEARLALVVSLGALPERMPDPRTRTLAGLALPEIVLASLEPSAPIKVELALERCGLPAA